MTNPTFEEQTVAFQRDSVRLELMNDFQMAEVEQRVIALEQLLATRWPARLVAAFRLGRAIRKSVEGFAWAGPDFYSRRIEASGNVLLCGRDVSR
jgi:hypothetical protein